MYPFHWGRNRIENEHEEIVKIMIKKTYTENEAIRNSLSLFEKKEYLNEIKNT